VREREREREVIANLLFSEEALPIELEYFTYRSSTKVLLHPRVTGASTKIIKMQHY
jgi:hypothetical protein